MKSASRWLACALTVALAAQAAIAQTTNQSPQQRRMAVIAAAAKGAAGLPVLTAAMKDENVVVRRAAVRGLSQLGAPALKVLSSAVQHDADALVRRTALRAVAKLSGDKAPSLLAPALKDSSAMVRRDAVEFLAARRPHTPEVLALLKQAQSDASAEVSRIATDALWPFYKETRPSRERPDLKDTHLSVAQSIALPADGWKFKTDPREAGHLQNWFAPDFDDSGWEPIGVGKVWEEFGHKYDGVAWYRGTITLPEKPDHRAVDLSFGAVDESAWVWINGQYAGQHEIGPGGWDQPFAMEVTEFLKWGQPNQITIRVLDRMYAGGIYKPVTLEVLKR